MGRWIVLACLICFCNSEAGAQHEVHWLTASDAAPVNNFGFAVAMSGDLTVIGAPFGYSGPGSTYVFDMHTGQELRKLVPTGCAEPGQFGYSVALAGDVAAVGAKVDHGVGSNTGSAYVFDVTTGQQSRKLVASDGATSDDFGCSIALSGNVAVIGAMGDDDIAMDAGSAYLFDVATGQQLRKLTDPDSDPGGLFGGSVAVSGNLALVGAYLEDEVGTDSGVAYVFDMTTGQRLHKLTPLDGGPLQHFGYSVAASGNLALVGAPNDSEVRQGSGAAYLFDLSTGLQLLKLKAVEPVMGAELGNSVALWNDVAMAGAGRDVNIGEPAGAAYVFDVATGRQLYRISASSPEAYDLFGSSVAVAGNLVVIGSRGDDDRGDGSGSASVFSLPSFPYGVGCAGSGGVIPAFGITGNATAGGLLRLEVRDAVGGSVAFIALGFQRAGLPMGAGCTLYVNPATLFIIGPFNLYPYHGSGPGVGWLDIPVIVPSSAPPGLTFTTQAFIPDGGAPRGFSASNGLETLIR